MGTFRLGYRLAGFGPGYLVASSALSQPNWTVPESTFDIDFVNKRSWISDGEFENVVGSGNAFDDSLTFSRDSVATYFDSSGILQTAATNTLRFDYDPSTLEPKGVIIEGTRTNVVLFNRDLTNAVWVKSNITALKDQTGIDGTSNSASSIVATSNNGTCLQAITLSSSARFQTAYLKRVAGSGTIQMTMDNGSTWTNVNVTDTWTRVSIPSQTLSNPTIGFRIVTSGDAIAVDYVQNENGVFSSSAIETTSSSVPRGRDILTTTLGDWFNASAGTWIVEYTSFLQNNFGEILTISNGSDSERIIMRHVNSGTIELYVITQDVVTVNSLRPGTVSAGAVVRLAFALADNNFGASINGATAVTDTSGQSPPVLTTAFIGDRITGGGQSLFGHIRRLSFIDRRVNNSELQVLSD